MLAQESRDTIVVTAVLMTAATVVVLLRILARRTNKVPLGHDDFAIVFALVIAWANGILEIVSSANDSYALDLDEKRLVLKSQIIFVGVILTHVVYGAIKISLLLLYQRIFPVRWLQTTVNVLVPVIIAWVVTATFGQCFAVTPISGFWERIPHFNFNYGAFLCTMAVIDFSADGVIVLLPMPIINSFQITQKKRWLLIGVFGVGIFCIAATIMRFYYSFVSELIEEGLRSPADLAETQYLLDLWANIETCVSIIGACLPTLAPIITKGSVIFTFFSSLKLRLSYPSRREPVFDYEAQINGDRQRSSMELVPGKRERNGVGSRANIYTIEQHGPPLQQSAWSKQDPQKVQRVFEPRLEVV